MRVPRVLGVLLVLLLAATALPARAVTAESARDRGPQPGRAGAEIVLDRLANYFRFDAATDAAGTTYIGWLSAHPADELYVQAHVCVLPSGATACAGGVQTTDALEKVTAEQLFVVAGERGATLVWHHMLGDTATGDPMQDRIAAAQVVDGRLQPGVDLAAVPSNSRLLAVNPGPRGLQAALVSGPDDDSRTVYVYDGLASAPSIVTAPWTVDNVEIADDGRSTVLVVTQQASNLDPVSVAWKPSGSGSWSPLTGVAGTRTDYDTARLATTRRGIRLLATAEDRKRGGEMSSVAAWNPTRHAFGKPVPVLEGQSCTTGGRDVAVDASGRMASVTIGCDELMIGNHPAAGAGALVEFSDGYAVTKTDAQIATAPSGRGWVVWLGTIDATLHARPILLPALTQAKAKRAAAGRAILTAPVSCVPWVSTKVGVKGKPARGWKVAGTSVRLGSRAVKRSFDASRLTPGRRYVLKGSVTFTRPGARRTVTASAPFTVCPAP